jgi:prophage antirepressor-like protein
MNRLQIFNNDEFGEIRTVTIDGEPWLCATDVAQALGYKNPRKAISDHCRGVTKRDTPTSSGVQSISYINEGDMYRLIMKSKLPSAEKFEKWVMEEVLPSIRKTGTYSVPQTTAGQIQLLAQGHMELEQKIDDVNKDLQTFKQEMPLLALECQRITVAKNKKVVSLLNGKESNAYRNASLRGRVYRDLESQLRREFGISTYKALHRNQTDKAIEIINGYELPLCLYEEIRNENQQIRL